jgi:hypothetical protein
MGELSGPDANGIRRYTEATAVGLDWPEYMNLGLEEISEVIGAKANHAMVALASGTITAQNIISLEGLTGFDEYEIVLDLPTASTANTITAQLLSGTTPNATSNYDRQDLVGSVSTAVATSALAAANWGLDQPGSRTDRHITLTLFGLNATRRTIAEVRRRAFDATANSGAVFSALRHRSAASFDGIRFTCSGVTTVTGTYTVKATRYA